MGALIFALSITAIHASTIYSATALGSMGDSSAVAFGIHASGMAVGRAENAIGSARAFASVKGGLLHLPGLSSAPDSFAYGVNPFLLLNGVYQDLDALPGGDWSAAYGIDKSSEVAGYGDIAPTQLAPAVDATATPPVSTIRNKEQ